MSHIRKRKISTESDEVKISEKSQKEISRKSTVYVIPISSFLSLLLGTILGSILAGPWARDLVDILRGYRWDYNNRCIMESPNADGYGVDFCRLPADCSLCSDIHEIDEVHVSDITHQDFSEKYAYSSRPLVVRNASLHWKAMKDLDYYWLKDQYLSDPEILDYTGDECWFNRYKTLEFRNLAAVFRLPDYRVKMEAGRPWYVGWAVCHKPVAEALYGLFERPQFIPPDSTPPSKPWIFIGTPGPGAHSHIDNVDLSSWQAQITGVKKWKLTAPPECSWTCGSKPLETIIYPGDIIVINTNYWFHSTQILGDQLSLVITNEYD
eukprot:TRINITY_DN1158_c0_g1_i1.p1 TRINITY_DN1158_c0_g1~~TRINITY_DN1158_c0_g1_i1.p1  ORF type:complete len:323 (+),score=35.70 TRINITY_DN1158_c0_g1_i1:201-1169(+)